MVKLQLCKIAEMMKGAAPAGREEMCMQQGARAEWVLLGWHSLGEHGEPEMSQQQAVKKAENPKEERKHC